MPETEHQRGVVGESTKQAPKIPPLKAGPVRLLHPGAQTLQARDNGIGAKESLGRVQRYHPCRLSLARGY